MTLTKSQIVETLYDDLSEAGYSRKKCVEVVETLLEIMKSTMAGGDDILISGFGKFCVKEKGDRKGRNPATGDEMVLRQRRVVTFKCSSTLRNKVNNHSS